MDCLVCARDGEEDDEEEKRMKDILDWYAQAEDLERKGIPCTCDFKEVREKRKGPK